MALAALACFWLYHLGHFSEGFWSVVTVSAIARPTVMASCNKAMLRILGTLVGALVGFITAQLIGLQPLWLFLVFLVFTLGTTYVALQTKPWNYASIVAGFTAAIVIASTVLGDVHAVAIYRTLEVILGIGMMTLVSWCITRWVHSEDTWFDSDAMHEYYQRLMSLHYSRATLIYALLIAASSALSFLAWMWLRYPNGIWVTITILLIMEESLDASYHKAWLRFLGQTLAAVYGLLCVFLCAGDPWALSLALMLGFFISGCVIGSRTPVADMGNHMGSAIAIMLLAGGAGEQWQVVASRFFNVAGGIVIATLLMSVMHRYTIACRDR